MKRVLRLHEKDNVAVALDELQAGDEVIVVSDLELHQSDLHLHVTQHIPFAHKVALQPMSQHDTAYKFGLPIGRITAAVAAGEHVHTTNLESNRGRSN